MNVLVLCGGKSAERDISCISAAAIVRNLAAPYRPVLVHIDTRGRWRLQKDPKAFARHPKPFTFPFAKTPARLEGGGSTVRLIAGGRSVHIGAVFPVLHGPMGEDGTLQGYLELLGVPYVGCDVLGSAVSMDKVMTKRLAEQAGLPVLPYAVLERPYRLDAARRLKFPVFVKPSRMGSSIGVYKVKAPGALADAVRKAFRFDTTVIVEQGVPAREIECAVLGGGSDVRASIAGEIRPNAEFYSYEAKYLDPDGARLMIPAELPPRRMREVRALAVRAFRALGCYGLARVDFLMDKRGGKLWFNEANTLPGFTSISMYPKMWEASGLAFKPLTGRLIRLALARHRARARLRITRD
ncbi:MAG: D-alanine--D-alanine ligase [Elusimicrobia bacterium]|nr:D-alanine--D-alanine ligase [Elusimicrobiota bacterium]